MLTYINKYEIGDNMTGRFDDGLFLELEKETKEKLRVLAKNTERSMAAWVRNQIHNEFDKMATTEKEAVPAN